MEMRLKHAKVLSLTVLSIIAIFFNGTFSCSAQSIGQELHQVGNAKELNDYYRQRLLQISFVSFSRKENKKIIVQGTGFLVSPDWAITARHVLDPAINDTDFVTPKPSEIRILKADGLTMVPLEIVPGSADMKTIRPSSMADITLFQVKSQSTKPISEYACIETDQRKTIETGNVTVVAWRYLPSVDNSWELKVVDDNIVENHGPMGNFEYWGLGKSFIASMSGGAIFQRDKVVAVISNVVYVDGKPLEGGNYANVLRFASDVGLADRAKTCDSVVPGEKPMHVSKTQSEFMSSTCEGTVAWLPSKAKGGFWSFQTNGIYRVRPADLICDPSMCKCNGDKPESTIRLVINHNVNGRLTVNGKPDERSCRGEDTDRGRDPNLTTFYGMQVVPVFSEDVLNGGVISPATWLYRSFSSSFYRRRSDGSFFLSKGPGHRAPSKRPSEFNLATQLADNSVGKCSRNIAERECEDINAVASFDRAFKMAWPWHGYARKNFDPKSTLFFGDLGQLWTVPKEWMNQDVCVKNWIIPYTGTTESRSNRLPSISICTNSDWDGFFMRAFSPERGQSDPVHVYLRN